MPKAGCIHTRKCLRHPCARELLRLSFIRLALWLPFRGRWLARRRLAHLGLMRRRSSHGRPRWCWLRSRPGDRNLSPRFGTVGRPRRRLGPRPGGSCGSRRWHGRPGLHWGPRHWCSFGRPACARIHCGGRRSNSPYFDRLRHGHHLRSAAIHRSKLGAIGSGGMETSPQTVSIRRLADGIGALNRVRTSPASRFLPDEPI
jgi:hypothetical protein